MSEETPQNSASKAPNNGANSANQAAGDSSEAAKKPKRTRSRNRKKPRDIKPARSYESAENAAEIAEELIEVEGEAAKPAQKRRKKRSIQNQIKAQMNAGKDGWQKLLCDSVKINEIIHDERLRPWQHLDKGPNANERILITPLGGLGAIGANIMVIETAKSALIIDVGMSFPDEDQHGVDIVIPDFDYIRKIKDKIAAVLITHSHEDHIGAVPYLYKEFSFPLYGNALPLGMIANKFAEHGLMDKCSLFRPIEKRKIYEIADFEVEFIHITHSIADSSALAIKTPAGVVLHSGDFKIDHSPIDGIPSDLQRIAHYGSQGVLCFLSDSTNSWREGMTKSESSVGPVFERIFARSKGRVIMSTFSSNLHRIYQAITKAIEQGRKVCIIGRSMEKNLFTAMELGYLKLDKKHFIEPDELENFKDEQILIVTTGSQGETMSALYRMATDEHRHVKIKPSDQVIISARAIPGNETSVSNVIDLLLKAGAKVSYQEFADIHVSGHGAQEEQKLLLRLVQPKYFLPVHGEYNHILKHKESAMLCGVEDKNVYLMSNGDQIEVSPKHLKRVRTVKTGKTFIDNQVNREIEDDLVSARQQLALNGILLLNFAIDPKSRRFHGKPQFLSFGLVSGKIKHSLNSELEGFLIKLFADASEKVLNDKRALNELVRNNLRKYLFKKYKTYPNLIINNDPGR